MNAAALNFRFPPAESNGKSLSVVGSEPLLFPEEDGAIEHDVLTANLAGYSDQTWGFIAEIRGGGRLQAVSGKGFASREDAIGHLLHKFQACVARRHLTFDEREAAVRILDWLDVQSRQAGLF